MDLATVRCKAVVMMLLIRCLLLLSLLNMICVWFLVCCAVIRVLSSFSEERAGCFTLVAFLMSCWCSVVLIFDTMSCLQCVIVVFSNHTYLHFFLFMVH